LDFIGGVKIMGGVYRRVKKTARKITKGVGDIVEKAIEDPVKKIGKETFDIVMGTTDEERRAMLSGEMPTPDSPEVTPEVTPEVVPDDDTVLGRGRRRTKRSGQAGTILEEYGAISAKPIAKAVTEA
jgi:hypothetical protein